MQDEKIFLLRENVNLITNSLLTKKLQMVLDKTGLKRFTYDEMMIAVKDGQNFCDRPNSKIRMIKVQENPLS